MTEIPDEVYVIGIVRPLGEAGPVQDADTGVDVSPLTVLDADGEWALPAFTTRAKAELGMLNFMKKEDREQDALCFARVELDELLEALEHPENIPSVDYIGVDMGEDGAYPLIRL